MLQKSRELIYAVIAMVFITLGYLLIQVVYGDVPSASSFWGHSLGVLGFLLMLMTETLYSMRKRSKRAIWGKMSDWLEFHIFTGLVGPFMVLLHPGWQFRGLAGVLSLLTILIVISGIIGRYLYTAVPRTVDGVEVAVEELKRQATDVQDRLQELTVLEMAFIDRKKTYLEVSNVNEMPQNKDFTIKSSKFNGLWHTGVGADSRQEQHQLTKKWRQLNRAIYARQKARQLFSLWHTIHIPIGLTLFIVGFIHIGAAIYYAVLLK